MSLDNVNNIYYMNRHDLSNVDVWNEDNIYIGKIPSNVSSLRPTPHSYTDENGIFVVTCSHGKILVKDGPVGKWIYGKGYLTDDKLILTDYTIDDTYIENNSLIHAWTSQS
jgi:hypothetical protein